MKKELQQKNVRILREWSLLQPHHPKIVDDEFYLSIVCGTKSMEKAKKKLEAFFTWRAYLSKSEPYYTLRDPTDSYFRLCKKVGKCFPLPKTTPEGYRVLYICMSDCFDEFFDYDQICGYFHLTAELSVKLWPDMKGVFAVCDLNGLTAKRVARGNINSFQTSSRYFQDCFPFKMKGITLFNTPPIAETFYSSIVKPFLKDKLRERVTFTTENYSCLKKYLPEEMIPMDFGGKGKLSSDLNDEWYETLVEHKEWFKTTSLLVADETKRPPDSKPPTFGIEGTFRTLSID